MLTYNSDTDGDGLSDSDETTIGSDTFDPDTDNDGVLDGQDGNPLDPNSDSTSAGVATLFGVPGHYKIEVVLPDANHAFTLRNAAGDEAVDSDVKRGNGRSATFTLAENEVIDTVDAGLWTPATVEVKVWDDPDGNGLQDAGEPLLREFRQTF
ncbi:MAG: hypothetical protein ACE5FD_02545 [Anaerolineae bacterium]